MIGLLVVIVIRAVIALSLIGIYNGLVQLRVRADNAWADIDVQLKRRYDLIPNLVETVKGFTKEESTVFGDIANARAGLLNAHDPKSKIAATNKELVDERSFVADMIK